MNIMKLSIVTMCKARLDHLRKYAIPAAEELDFADKEIILIDYHCPEKATEYVERYHPSVKIFRAISYGIKHDEWSINHARNLGLSLATGDIILYLDADTAVKPEYVKVALEKFDIRKSIITCNWSYGSGMHWRENLLKIRGFNEKMNFGWGHEDRETYARCIENVGVKIELMDPALVRICNHDDMLRTRYSSSVNKWRCADLNRAVTEFASILQQHPDMPATFSMGNFTFPEIGTGYDDAYEIARKKGLLSVLK